MPEINLKLKISKEKLREKLGIKDGERGSKGDKGDRGAAGENANPDTAEQLRDKLEGLKKGKKLSIQAIDYLPEILEELRNKMGGGRDLGLLKGAIHGGKGNQIRFADDETPSGTKNSINTKFITLHTPLKNSLKVYRNGQRVRVGVDYTLSGRTITFLLIPPKATDIILVDYRY